jgi:hypothetical protein
MRKGNVVGTYYRRLKSSDDGSSLGLALCHTQIPRNELAQQGSLPTQEALQCEPNTWMARELR